jgi:hypothetical protein
MNPDNLTVWSCPYQKYRLGQPHDGGYVLCHLPGIEYSILLSGGIGGHCTFEDDLLEKYPNLTCIGCDGTVAYAPTKYPDRFFFSPTNIGTEEPNNLKSILREHDTLFVKMDIEGDEFPWLDCLEEELMNKISQIVIEFHNCFDERHDRVFQKLNKTHLLVHFHGNNYAPTIMHRGILFPTVFECCYIHRRYVEGLTLEKNTTPLPCAIDMPNSWGQPDIPLHTPPFCFLNTTVSTEAKATVSTEAKAADS